MSMRHWPLLPALVFVACKKEVPPPRPENPVRVKMEGPWRGQGTGTSAREATMVRDVEAAVKSAFVDAAEVRVIARESPKQERVVVLIRFAGLDTANEQARGLALESVRSGLKRDLNAGEAVVIGMKGETVYRAMSIGTTEDMLHETKLGPDVTSDVDDAIGKKL